jgi:hypothetical protein
MAGGSRDCSCPPQSRHLTGERPAPEIGHPGYTVLQNAPSQTATLLKTGEGGGKRKAEYCLFVSEKGCISAMELSGSLAVAGTSKQECSRMANHAGKGCFKKGESGNPGGRPKLPAEIREMFQAKAPEAFEVLCKHLHASDPKVSVTAAREILDGAWGGPCSRSMPTSMRTTAGFFITQ